MKKKNLLILCSDIKEINKIFRLDLSNYAKVILASDDIRVHKKIHKLDVIDKVIFLQKSISYPKVSESVVKMIDDVNIYFDRVAEKGTFNKKDLFWTYHVEGGYTTQIIQDVLLAIESAIIIFDQNMISELVTIGYDNTLSIKIIKKLAFQRGYKISSFDGRFFSNKNVIKDLIRPVYFFFKSLGQKITSKRLSYFNESNIVLFQVCGSSAKNVQNVLFLQNELSKNGFTSLNILWGSTKEVKRINKLGYKAIAIEYYLKYSDIFLSLCKAISILMKVKILKNSFYQTSTFTYKGMDVRDVVFQSIIKYLYTDVPEHYKYRVASQRFVSEYSKNIIAVKYCGAKFLNQGSILSEIMEDKYLKFDYDVGLRTLNPYIKYISKKHQKFLSNNFVRFAPNEIEKKHLMEDMGISEDSIIKFGAGRAMKHFDNKDLITKEESMRKIGIKKDYDIYALLEFSNPLMGYYSAEEVYYVLNALIEFVKIHKNIALIIKPAHSTDLSPLSDMVTNDFDNIYVVDKKTLPDHALNIADIIFCKFSTLGREAMIYDVQVVSTLFDNEKIFKVFGDAAHYIHKKEELIFFLEKTLYSKASFIQWKNSYREKRKFFMQENYPKLKKKTEEIVTETIKKMLNK